MKCFDGDNLLSQQMSLNHCVIRTRRVVEQAFGRLKGRWHVLVDSYSCDPDFASNVALLCCALHNVCERSNCPFEDSWLPAARVVPAAGGHNYNVGPPDAQLQALAVRDALSRYVHRIV